MKEKIISIINSCETMDQLSSCTRMLINYSHNRIFKNDNPTEVFFEYDYLTNILDEKFIELNYE